MKQTATSWSSIRFYSPLPHKDTRLSGVFPPNGIRPIPCHFFSVYFASMSEPFKTFYLPAINPGITDAVDAIQPGRTGSLYFPKPYDNKKVCIYLGLCTPLCLPFIARPYPEKSRYKAVPDTDYHDPSHTLR